MRLMSHTNLELKNWPTIKQLLGAREVELFLRAIQDENARKGPAANMNMPSISYVIARTEDGVIGCNNTLPWKMKTDLLRFRKITLGHVIIMGRNTFDSIGHALPQRENVVISRDSNFSPDNTKVFTTFEDAILYADVFSLARGLNDIFVIGGAVVFDRMKRFVSTAYVTEIHTSKITGDAIFSGVFDKREWDEVKKERHLKSDVDDYDSTFYIYTKRKDVIRGRGIRDFLTHAA